jgi:hypothetical protein
MSDDIIEALELDLDNKGGDGIGDGNCSVGEMYLEESSSRIDLMPYFCNAKSLSRLHS